QGDDFGTEGVVTEYVQVGVEELALLGAQLPLDLLLQLADVGAHRAQTLLEEADLRLDVATAALRNRREVCRRKYGHAGTDGHTGRSGHTVKARVDRLDAAGAEAHHGATCLGIGNDTGELCGKGDQEGFIGAVEGAPLVLLDDQN